ncbi:hypothetical protein ARALYDRAFT_488575 [Arabidopsis lyrata subsp. lyrata]|uniref:Cystatin domain-containing protein n=1 Tax=Arabidopsis lyrata subsp. lyrata TaxID=81972 RepID=D7LWX5_ARALL|nr:hypothetical protein ARALYDRAFT_488575 [Arabidopsis lyrata subsp. lyrata]
MAPESTAEQASATDMVNSSLMEEHKVEEEGSDIDRRYKYVLGPEPEWDLDSYDGREYESDPEDRQFFSDEDDYQEFRIRKPFLKLNDEKGNTVELVEIVRAIDAGGARWNSYITFMAREYSNGPLVEYQAKVMNYAGNEKPPFPILCRPSPKLSV